MDRGSIMKIMGIDPGLFITGYAILEVYSNKEPKILEAEIIKTKPRNKMEERILAIYEGLNEILSRFVPNVVALEDLYSHYDNPKTAIIMAHARGIAYLSAAKYNIKVVSYSPTKVKKALTGNGRASKEQIQKMIQSYLKLPDLPQPNDVADALAVAICHANTIFRTK